MRIAVSTLAGIPNATVVIRLPPMAELFAAPGPSTPRQHLYQSAPDPWSFALLRIGQPLGDGRSQPGNDRAEGATALQRITSHQ